MRSRVSMVVLLAICGALSLAGCSSDEGGNGDRTGGGASGPGGSGPGLGSSGSGAPVSSGAFGNPTNPMAGGAPVGSTMSLPDAECATAEVYVTRVTPTIYFVIDGSGSMCAPFNGPTRWQALRTALLDPMNGVIYRLNNAVHFGMMLYDGGIDLILAATAIGGSPTPPCAGGYAQMKAMGECPLLIDVPPALGNAANIDAAFPAVELGGSTPTDRSLNVVVDTLIAQQNNDPDAEQNPQYIILATDGAPNDICFGGLGGDGSLQQQAVMDAVTRAANANIKTFVISLAGNDPGLQAHLDQVAVLGDPGNPMAHTFNPATPDELVNDIANIVGGAVGCQVGLAGTVVQGQECRGKVVMNGNELPCCQGDGGGGFTCSSVPTPAADGWLLTDPSTIELSGSACIDFVALPEVMLRASFPCDVYVE